jgi:hypothetical protein
MQSCVVWDEPRVCSRTCLGALGVQVAAVAAVPSFQPDPRSQQLNAFAKFIGDDRADKVGVWIGA